MTAGALAAVAHPTRRWRIHLATMTGNPRAAGGLGLDRADLRPRRPAASVLTIAGQRDARLRERCAAPRQAAAEAISARSPGDVAVAAAVLNDLAGRLRDARLG